MDERGFETMNVIPLVDVMLVLLTIVLTTSTFIATGAIPVKLPEAENVESTPTKTCTIVIDKDGHIYLDELPVSLTTLEAGLQQLSRTVPILIRADRTIALQHFVSVMDLFKRLGFTKISLQTETSQS